MIKIDAKAYINHFAPFEDFVSPYSFTQEQKRQKLSSDSYSMLEIYPGLKESEQLGDQLPVDIRLLPDIVCFASRKWVNTDDSLLLTLRQFAAGGHRVFYVFPENFLKNDISPRIGVRMLEPGVAEVVLASVSFFDVPSLTLEDDNTLKSLLLSLGELRTLYGIDECIVYISHPAWGRLAQAALQKWDWRIIYDLAHYESIPDLQTSAHQLLLEHANLVIASHSSQIANLSPDRLLVWKPEYVDWDQRYQSIYKQYVSTVPLASIVVVTHNNLAYTQLCITSILRNTEYPNYEIIVVDNCSSDDTVEYLRALEQVTSNVRVILNQKNDGFAKGNNLGLEQAKGEFLVLLNNDTIVPPGWLSRLLWHLRDSETGIIGPLSNSVGNGAKLDVEYATWGEMEVFAQTHNWSYDNQVSDIHMLGMFCVALRRDVYNLIGPLDEQFGVGTFEDDDYCMRIREKGYRILCALDVFVHHFGSATFSKYVNISKIYQENQPKYEKKWGLEWLPYVHEILVPCYHINADFMLSENEKNELLKRNISEYQKKFSLLNDNLAKKDQEISSLNQVVLEKNSQINFLNAQVLSVYSSSSWKITRPLRFLRRFVAAPRQSVSELIQYLSNRFINTHHNGKTYRLARKINAAWKRLIGHEPDLTWDKFVAHINLSRSQYKGVLVLYSTIDWGSPYAQRPGQIALALAKQGYAIIYHTPNHIDHVYDIRQVKKNIWITSVAIDEIEIENAVHVVYSTLSTLPVSVLCKKRNQGQKLVYEYIDHISPMISGDGEPFKRLLELKDFAFTGGVDYIVATARQLAEEATQAIGGEHVLYSPNGVDILHYRNPAHKTTKLPANFTSFCHRFSNIVGYFGAIAPWLWYEMLEKLTKMRPDLGFVFIGSDYNGGLSSLPKRPNVLHLKAVDYKVLPAYALCFDVCLIPFAPGEIARTTSPLKLFEYFALEKPVVVTSFMDECVVYDEVFSGDSANSISKAIDKAVKVKDNLEYKSRLALLAEQNSWEARARDYGMFFSSVAKNT